MEGVIDIPRGDGNLPEPGEYQPVGRWMNLMLPDGTESAILSCPVCSIAGDLIGHVIDRDGMVAPSFGCPCGFHSFIRLLGWQPRETDAP